MIWMIIGYGKSYLDKCSRDHIGAYAAQAAYFMIMSAIPFLMLLFAILRVAPSVTAMFDIRVLEVLPETVRPYAIDAIELIMQSSIGAVSISAVMAVWAAGKAFQNLMVGLNVVNGIKETRNWFVTRVWAVIYTIILLMAIVMTMFLLVFAQQLKDLFTGHYGFIAYIVGIKPIFRWLFVFAVLTLVFTLMFKYLPNTKLTFMSQLPGGIIAAASWYIFSGLLSVWIDVFGGFSMYGAMATIMIMMVWLYMCMYFMLMAAEANKFFEQAFMKRRERR